MPQSFVIFSAAPLNIANSNTLVSLSNVNVAVNSLQSILPSDNNRISVIATNTHDTITIFIGGPTTSATEGTPIEPKQSFSVNTRAEVFVFNPDLTFTVDMAISLTQIIEP